MEDGNPPFGIVESKEYTSQLKGIGDIQRIDSVLIGQTNALAENPHVYDVVPGVEGIRILKTKPAGEIPPLCIWFRIEPDIERVHLLWVERIDGSQPHYI